MQFCCVLCSSVCVLCSSVCVLQLCCVFCSSSVCAAVLLCVLQFCCVFCSSSVCAAVLLCVLQFCCVFCSSAVCSAVLPCVLQLFCVFWSSAVCSAVLLHVTTNWETEELCFNSRSEQYIFIFSETSRLAQRGTVSSPMQWVTALFGSKTARAWSWPLSFLSSEVFLKCQYNLCCNYVPWSVATVPSGYTCVTELHTQDGGRSAAVNMVIVFVKRLETGPQRGRNMSSQVHMKC